MKDEVKILLVWFVILLIGSASGLRAENISFEYLGLQEGVSQVSVTSMVQDETGRLWIGTRDGLNLYDGKEVKVFRPIRGDSSSLLGHNIRFMNLDEEHLWVTTYHGVSKLDIKTLQFEQFRFDGVLSVVVYDNTVLLGTTRGLFRLDEMNKAFTLKGDILDVNCVIKNLYVDNANVLWICSDKGLYKYNPDTKVTTKVFDSAVSVVYSDSQKRIWIGTNNDGVILLNRQGELIRSFRHKEDNTTLVNDIIRDINEDSQGNIWVGTFLGISIIDGRNLTIENFQQDDSMSNSLSHNSVYCIMRDQQGTMWVGTYFGAISYYNPDFHVYKKYAVSANKLSGVNYHVVGKMLEDDKNNLWIATEGGGLDYLNRVNQTFKHYVHHEGELGLSHNNVKSLLKAGKKYLLIGTHMGGLNILNLQTQTFENYKHSPNDTTSISSNVITSIIPYQNYYLLGTHRGIIKFDIEHRTFTEFITDKDTKALIGNVIFCLFEDSFGKLWIGTERNGLCLYDPDSKTVKRYLNTPDATSLSNNTISCIFEDHQFRLWIGTLGGGVNQFLRREESFLNYSAATHQFPSDFIYGVQESRYGNLWISTSKGMVRFDIENNKAYNYHHNNGFPLQELNEGALLLTSDGEVFVGGINGMVSFKEEDLLKQSNDYSLHFTSLYVNNEQVVPGDETGLLSQDLLFTKSITLEPEQDIFTIHFSSCNYISSNQSRYEYQLENFNNEWIKAGSQQSVTYTNLDPGTYDLKIRVLSSDDDVVDSQSIQIIVNPPIYKTWYAYLIYLVLIIAIILWLNQIYLSRVRLEDSLKAEKRDKDKIKELNQSKLRFFTNISHEFRTPLTLITGTLEAILEDTKTSARNYKKLLTINNNAVRLNNLVTELLDFRKLEQGFMKIRATENNIPVFLEEIFHSFVEFAHHRRVKYTLSEMPGSMVLWFDKKQMEKVFYNLISNAFKVVDDEEGEIKVSIKEQQGYVDIIVSDNGPGMPPEEMKKIFDRYYQIDKVKGKISGQGSGIGLSLAKGIVSEHHGEVLVESEKGKGTAFFIRLQKGNKHFNSEQITVGVDPEVIESEAVLIPIDDTDSGVVDEVPETAPVVLIVEDNKEARSLLKDVFSPIYRVIEAEDGKTGLSMALEQQPDLILSDVMMPNMSGTQMCAKLKRNIQTCHIPIILLTARTAIEYKIEGIETGADDYITKPFNIKLLRARVKNLLYNRQQLQQKFKQDPNVEVKEVATNSMDQKLLEKARQIVEKYIDDTEFDVNTFAREISLGRTRLYAKIKGITGQTPNEFILSIRLKKAAEMLTGDGDLNVSEIAYAVGFSTPRYFSRCFREHFGVSPSKYGTEINTGNEPTNES
ncbi:response regulator [Carboxylicivirga sp. A043]|uniref:hybrid sensor histidine kinase/response regulator n=1 Tax=Carboxylicivirga litoralis TaxID=2816963 RepID=UPI0021CB8A8F|nr:two-component regulator propeller domain-containing protein [Carboxylicivirga sp. A043]MCU4157145.1 response regulator [Carboxylicivirga sp. A043]